MGKITLYSANKFKSPEFIYSKIKRQWQSFGSVNLVDDMDFPAYTADVLRMLGQSVYKEEEVVLKITNKKAQLPRDFRTLHAAYSCCPQTPVKSHLQTSQVVSNTLYFDIIKNSKDCKISCAVNEEQLVERITVKQFVNEGMLTTNYGYPTLLHLSPNIKEKCTEDCVNQFSTSSKEITINNGCIFTNFEGEDNHIYMQYYAFPFDEDGNILIPDDDVYLEHAIEWYIKWQLMLNYWMVDDVANVQNRWQKAEEQFQTNLAECKFLKKLPAFATLVDDVRLRKGINKVAFFSQMDKRR